MVLENRFHMLTHHGTKDGRALIIMILTGNSEKLSDLLLKRNLCLMHIYGMKQDPFLRKFTKSVVELGSFQEMPEPLGKLNTMGK